MSEKKIVIGSLQPDIEDILKWNDLSDTDFQKADAAEKEDFIPQRSSISYWADAWRRLRKNTVAMVALGVLIFISFFAFLGPVIVPYGYEEFNRGAENLHPWHTSLEDQLKLVEAMEVKSPEEAVAAAQAEAAAQGKTLNSRELAQIRAQARSKTQYKDAEGKVLSGVALEKYLRKELGIKNRAFGYSRAELERKAAGEFVFPTVSAPINSVATPWFV